MSDVMGGGVGVTSGDDAWRRVTDMLWRGYDRYRGMLDVIEFGDVLLLLVYLRSRPAWDSLSDGGLDLERAILADLAAGQEDPAILRPLLDSVRKAREASLAPLNELVTRLSLDAELPLTRVFGALLAGINLTAGRKGGEFHTPEAITELAAVLLDPKPGDRLLDPCCKAGEFPAAILDRLTQSGDVNGRLTIAIADYTARSAALAYLNLRLRGVTPRVLPSPVKTLPAGAPDHRFDVVTANPPFNLTNWSNTDRVAGRWRYDVPPAHNANYAWLQYVVASLDQGGRAAVVMTHGAGQSENRQEQSIRASMIEDGVVSAIIALPAQLFTATDIPVTLWLLRLPSGERTDEVLFVDATDLGGVRHRGRRTLSGPDIHRIEDAYRQWREHGRHAEPGFAAAVSLEKIRASRYRLNPRAYVASSDVTPDSRTQARQVGELTQRLHQLAEQAASVDRTVDAYLEELSL
ncbi:hypothetical protein Vqi01_41630 [Micromonospora qiuiae]|uniref:DNA methylase adenine-specific domain-containing protein n=1 Tax=Micromonospora qiuiae TaxID=502268 RepID=A0ABQ4JFN5_9ACTN|nr:N-6 DNA methylase [Micromonospora qiuiae]GIJ29001.1 hypothetical protein Vqi01_41630 [Micromonospora qiuiae]